MMSFQEQQKLVNELLADRSLPVDTDRPKTFSPRPRSERICVVMTCNGMDAVSASDQTQEWDGDTPSLPK